ncbi:hypothetical protein CRENBAI_012511 [Crenichthys baileyi]|uniref:Golgin subfamily A member 7/ERF4 domain-containing protein n=1 Tax=Crenichthys baileyi TaxID=28760 RepID=A0AAV9R296_9TELE
MNRNPVPSSSTTNHTLFKRFKPDPAPLGIATPTTQAPPSDPPCPTKEISAHEGILPHVHGWQHGDRGHCLTALKHAGRRSAPRTEATPLRPSSEAASFHNLQELRHSASLANKVFIQRDYSEGTTCRFQTKFPSELESRIERTLFEDTVKTLNNFYAEAEKIGGQSYLEGCLACVTAYLIFLCMETRYEKVLKKIGKYIQEQNEKIYAPRGLLITDPIERGMRVIEISIYEDRGSSGSSSGSSSVSGSTAR